MKHFWVVRFDYEKTLGLVHGEMRTYRCTARLGVVAVSITEAIDAVRTKEADYPKCVIWGVSHQGQVGIIS